MYGFFIFLLFSQQSDAGFLCSKQMMTYQTAIDSCFLQSGKPVIISLLNKDSIQNELGNRLSVWTQFYANTISYCNEFGNIRTVCGYQYYLVNTPDDITIFEEVRYGDCNGKRYYVCERESHIYGSFKENFAAATSCNFPDLEKWKDKATTEYYWKPYSRTNMCLLNANSPIQRDEELPNCLGYAYDTDGGYYLIACSSLRTMLCEFKDDGHVRTGYGACKTVGHTSTTMAKETTTIQTNSTQKSEPTNSQGTTVRKQYSTFDRDTTNPPVNVNIATKDITETIDTDTPPLTHSNNEQTIQDLEDRNHDDVISAFSSYIGVLILACVIIVLFVNVLMIVRHRRAHTNRNNQSKNSCSMDINLHDEATDSDHNDTTIGATSKTTMSRNDYDVMDKTKHEDVYTTTKPERQGNQVTDNNRLDTADGDRVTIYDTTSSEQQTESTFTTIGS